MKLEDNISSENKKGIAMIEFPMLVAGFVLLSSNSFANGYRLAKGQPLVSGTLLYQSIALGLAISAGFGSPDKKERILVPAIYSGSQVFFGALGYGASYLWGR